MDSEEELEVSSAAADAETEEPMEEPDKEGGDSDDFIPGFATVEDFCKVWVVQHRHSCVYGSSICTCPT